jgi:hypothetical protein
VQEEHFNQLRRAISGSRLTAYSSGGRFLTYGTYAWNIAICESLYPGLHCLEVTLRNSIQEAASKEFGDEYWFRNHLAAGEQDRVARLTRDLNSQSKPLRVGDFVSGLTFGFWVNLFNSNYEQSLWPQLVRPVFPNVPRSQRARHHIFHRLNTIRELRNRVFHHEPVWHYPDLQRQHGLIIETIGWINPAMRRFVEMLDRFPETYAKGAGHYEQGLVSAFKADQKENVQAGG